MEEKYCQSCGMPMGQTDELYGTEQDGRKSKDYCQHCYQNGTFTAPVTMDQMIDICVPFVVQANSEMSENEARTMMQQFFPHLKRWKQ